MKEINVSALFKSGLVLSDYIGHVHGDVFGAPKHAVNVTHDFTDTEIEAYFGIISALGLPATSSAMKTFEDAVNVAESEGRTLDPDVRIRMVSNIRTPLAAELASILFLYIENGQTRYWKNSLDGWEDVLNILPECSYDIEEASKCLALDRSTASAFHSMRVVEVGLKYLWKMTGLNPKAQTWGAYLDAIEKFAQTAPYPSNSIELQNIANHLRTIKNAWRNQTMHVEAKYTEEEASDIYNALKPLMKGIVKL